MEQPQNKIEVPEKFLNLDYIQPEKKIKTELDLETFKKSQTFHDYMTFITNLQSSVKSKKISQTPKNNPKFTQIITYLHDLQQLVKDTPPLEQKMRFGNTAFKTWHQKTLEKTDEFLKNLLPESLLEKNIQIELKTYLADSYGSNVRLDYGTGHEMAFAFFLMGLYRLNFYQQGDFEQLVREVFYEYIKLMRDIQLTYMLEPAGSHGVWGLDDYHFLPFLFGAAELVENQDVPVPDGIHDLNKVEKMRGEYMYLECINFIREVKKGPFHEHSPLLNDISGAASWAKVMMGMVKMYQAEVLFKFPVSKHIFFGNLIPFN